MNRPAPFSKSSLPYFWTGAVAVDVETVVVDVTTGAATGAGAAAGACGAFWQAARAKRPVKASMETRNFFILYLLD